MKIKSLFMPLLVLAGAVSFNVLADPTCTQEPQDKWMPKEDAQKMVESAGYKVKKFKTTSTGCYELYGFDQEGNRVEIYYNPVDMSVVEEGDDD